MSRERFYLSLVASLLMLLVAGRAKGQDIEAARTKLTQALGLLPALSQSLTERESDLRERNSLLTANENALTARESELIEREASLNARESDLIEREILTDERQSALDMMGQSLATLSDLYKRQSTALKWTRAALLAVGVAALFEGLALAF